MPRGRKKRSEKTNINILKYPQNVKRDAVELNKDLLYQLIIQPDFKNWTLPQHKLLTFLFSPVESNSFSCNGNIELENSEVADKLGWDISKDLLSTIGSIIRSNYRQMADASEVSLPFAEEDSKNSLILTENLISGVGGSTKFTNVEINKYFIPHMRNVSNSLLATKSPYITFIQSDILESTCQYMPMLFYTMLYLWNNSDEPYKTLKISVPQLKALIGMEQDAYMSPNKSGEKVIFSKYGFNKKILIPMVENLSRCETIELLPWEDGELFKFEKAWGCVPDYSFKFRVRSMREIIENREKALEAEVEIRRTV